MRITSGLYADRSVGGDCVDGLLATADTWAIDDLDLHVALVSPGGGPRVSHDPVVNAVSRAVANHGDGMIELSSARGAVHDSRVVGLEGALIGLNQDRDRLLVKSGLNATDAVGSDFGKCGSLDSSASSIVATRAVSASISVAGLRHGGVRLEVSE